LFESLHRRKPRPRPHLTSLPTILTKLKSRPRPSMIQDQSPSPSISSVRISQIYKLYLISISIFLIITYRCLKKKVNIWLFKTTFLLQFKGVAISWPTDLKVLVLIKSRSDPTERMCFATCRLLEEAGRSSRGEGFSQLVQTLQIISSRIGQIMRSA